VKGTVDQATYDSALSEARRRRAGGGSAHTADDDGVDVILAETRAQFSSEYADDVDEASALAHLKATTVLAASRRPVTEDNYLRCCMRSPTRAAAPPPTASSTSDSRRPRGCPIWRKRDLRGRASNLARVPDAHFELVLAWIRAERERLRLRSEAAETLPSRYHLAEIRRGSSFPGASHGRIPTRPRGSEGPRSSAVGSLGVCHARPARGGSRFSSAPGSPSST
jgi:hypothetical protein